MSTNKKSLFGVFLAYIKKPSYNIKEKKQKYFLTLIDVFKLWSVALFFIIFLGLLMAKIVGFFGYDAVDNSKMANFFELHWLLILFFVFVWAPLIEELAFRLGLKFSPYRLSFCLAFLSFFFIIFIVELYDLRNSFLSSFISLSKFGLLTLPAYILLIGLGLGALFKRKKHYLKIKNFYQEKFPYIFYFSALLFSLIHILNYQGLRQYFYLVVLLVIPQLVISLFLGFARMRYGFSWAVFMHFMHNFLIALPLVLLSLLPAETIASIQNNQAGILENFTIFEKVIMFFLPVLILLIFFSALIALIKVIIEYVRPASEA